MLRARCEHGWSLFDHEQPLHHIGMMQCQLQTEQASGGEPHHRHRPPESPADLVRVIVGEVGQRVAGWDAGSPAQPVHLVVGGETESQCRLERANDPGRYPVAEAEPGEEDQGGAAPLHELGKRSARRG